MTSNVEKVMKPYKEFAGNVETIKGRLKKIGLDSEEQKYIPLHRLKEALERMEQLKDEEMEHTQEFNRTFMAEKQGYEDQITELKADCSRFIDTINKLREEARKE